MKRRRNLLVVLLALCTLCVGVGYAALSATLTINGKAGISRDAIEFIEDVVFIDSASDNEDFGTATHVENGRDASFEVTGMTRAGDTVVFTYTIENQSDVTNANIAITVQPERTDSVEGYDNLFEVNTTLSANTIAAGGSITATVTVTLTKNVEQLGEVTEVTGIAYTMSYTATSAE